MKKFFQICIHFPNFAQCCICDIILCFFVMQTEVGQKLIIPY